MLWKHLIAIMATLPAQASAQEPTVDAAVVEACLESAWRDTVDPDCIGFAARLCQGRAGETTIGISQCSMAEAEAWDALLNREYKAAREHFARIPGIADKLKTAQKGWIALRDADCEIAYDRYEGGSMRSISSASCQMEYAARRAIELKRMYEP